ncbi:MAG: ROK family protein [Spirochaetales bacterium]|nr:ROK family protein [Spirochaetales bacterium]
MNIYSDDRVVMTLDAGGTNFVFSAIQGGKEIVNPIRMPSNADDLDRCISSLVDGFQKVKDQLTDKPVAISFAFPGPADYPNGIIGDLPNLPAFRGGIALGPMLEDYFGIPVFINNDGDLYAYGEAIAGFLPEVNQMLEKAGSPKRFKNLVGITLGTGFGVGIVIDNVLLSGDNSSGGEGWLLANCHDPSGNIEEAVSIRAVKKFYAEAAGISAEEAPEPKDIYDIGLGTQKGDKAAAIKAFEMMGEALGDALAKVLILTDSLAVIGGGVSAAHKLFLKKAVERMNSPYVLTNGAKFSRVVAKVYNLEDDVDVKGFLTGAAKEISVPKSDKKVIYDSEKRTGVGISKIGTSEAIAIGAYAFALHALEN